MCKILFIDSTVRENSRTKELALHILKRLGESHEHLWLKDAAIPPLTREWLALREESSDRKSFEDPRFDYAKQFAAADIVVIAAPFWDNSFPAVLKKYIESVSVRGLTFEYTANGMPHGLCRAKTLIYVTTAGGTIYNDAYGYGYIKELANVMFGIPEVYKFTAEGLDIVGADCDVIMKNAKDAADKFFDKSKGR